MSDRKQIKRIPKNDVAEKPRHVLYDAFCLQMSAAIELARKIESDKTLPVPGYLQRFLDEFGRKTA
jgi:hypothetical protein